MPRSAVESVRIGLNRCWLRCQNTTSSIQSALKNESVERIPLCFMPLRFSATNAEGEGIERSQFALEKQLNYASR